jgi:hypothetical protein
VFNGACCELGFSIYKPKLENMLEFTMKNIRDFSFIHNVERYGTGRLQPIQSITTPFAPFVQNNSFINSYEDVYILSPFGIILDKNFEPIWEAMNEVIYWCGRPAEFPELIKEYGIDALNSFDTYLPRVEKRIEEYLVAAKSGKCKIEELEPNADYVYASHPFNEMVFGHLYDTFQRLYFLRDYPKKDLKLILASQQRIHDFRRHLQILDFDIDIITREKGLSLLKVPSLVVPELPIHPAGTIVETFDWFYEKYVENNQVVQEMLTENTRLYLDRSDINREHKRSFVDETRIGNYLQSQGFKTHLNLNGIDETVARFNSADIVFGAHGAAFSNIMFCGKSTKIFEFMPKSRYVNAFGKLPKKSPDYWLVTVDCDENANLKVPLEFVQELVSGNIGLN